MEQIKEQLFVKLDPDLPFFTVGLPKNLIKKYDLFLYSFVIVKQGLLEVPCRITQNDTSDSVTVNTAFSEYIGLKKNQSVSVIAVSNEIKPIYEITPLVLSLTDDEKKEEDLTNFLEDVQDIFVFNRLVFKRSSYFISFNVKKKDTTYTISKEFTKIAIPRHKLLSRPTVIFLVMNSSSMNRKKIDLNPDIKSIVDLFEIPKSEKVSYTVAAYVTIMQVLKSNAMQLNQEFGVVIAKDSIYDFVIFNEQKDTKNSISSKEDILKNLDNFLNFLNVHLYGEGVVNYANALTYTENIIKKEKKNQVLIFIFNDGNQFTGEHPSEIIKKLTEMGIQFYPVCFNPQENPICELFEELFEKNYASGRSIKVDNIPQTIAEIMSVINYEGFLRQIYGGVYD